MPSLCVERAWVICYHLGSDLAVRLVKGTDNFMANIDPTCGLSNLCLKAATVGCWKLWRGRKKGSISSCPVPTLLRASPPQGRRQGTRCSESLLRAGTAVGRRWADGSRSSPGSCSSSFGGQRPRNFHYLVEGLSAGAVAAEVLHQGEVLPAWCSIVQSLFFFSNRNRFWFPGNSPNYRSAEGRACWGVSIKTRYI